VPFTKNAITLPYTSIFQYTFLLTTIHENLNANSQYSALVVERGRFAAAVTLEMALAVKIASKLAST
jgi:hypothetical protein